jgi:hypothetical protein
MGQPKVEFEKVQDKRGKRIRGLWRRGEVLYVQLRVTNPTQLTTLVRRTDLLASNDTDSFIAVGNQPLL